MEAKTLLFIIFWPVLTVLSADELCERLRSYHLHVTDPEEFIIHLQPNRKAFCLSACKSHSSCQAVSWSATQGICKFHPFSPYSIRFNGNVAVSTNWMLLILELPSETGWRPVAKFSTSSGNFTGKRSYELWTNPYESENDDVSLLTNIRERSSRHYVHKEKDWLMGLHDVTKVKLSLYENSTEAAWAIFEKKPGADDNWFQPSRVIDSFPWDTELLRSSAEMSLAPQEYDRAIQFYVVKSNPGYTLRPFSPHAYWMKTYESIVGSNRYGLVRQGSLCVYRTTNTPLILFSKTSNPTLLTDSDVSLVVNWTAATGREGHYGLYLADSENYCQTHLGTEMPTVAEMDHIRITQPYQCCSIGWMAGPARGFPMNDVILPCGNRTATIVYGLQNSANIYCKTNTNQVGVADALVISVNI